jgi:hypothetical protein
MNFAENQNVREGIKKLVPFVQEADSYRLGCKSKITLVSNIINRIK